ncbi:hypothetical protein [Pseudomonas phage D6]|nr:hypothetical protein [Pseudomonas phage D6]
MALNPLPSQGQWEDQYEESELCYEVAEELHSLGIPHPSTNDDMSWTAYEDPSYALKYLRPQLRETRDEVMARAKNHLPMQYHAVISAALQDAITDTACKINNQVHMVDEGHTELWGLHLNLWNTQTRNSVMSDTQVAQTTTESNAVVVAAINVFRTEALAMEDKAKAVDSAIIGTVGVLEEAFASGGIATVQGLSESLNASWAEAVNS